MTITREEYYRGRASAPLPASPRGGTPIGTPDHVERRKAAGLAPAEDQPAQQDTPYAARTDFASLIDWCKEVAEQQADGRVEAAMAAAREPDRISGEAKVRSVERPPWELALSEAELEAVCAVADMNLPSQSSQA